VAINIHKYTKILKYYRLQAFSIPVSKAATNASAQEIMAVTAASLNLTVTSAALSIHGRNVGEL